QNSWRVTTIANRTILRIVHLSSPKRAALLRKSCRGRSPTLRTRSNSFVLWINRGNYIESNESIGKKDFLMKIRTCRREAKESGYWLRLLDCDGQLEPARAKLVSEAQELMKIVGAILRKSEE